MEFFLNDRSLHGQFADGDAFLASLKTVLGMRKSIREAGYPFLVDKITSGAQVTSELFFSQVIQSTKNINLIREVRGWLDKSGPFWQKDREHSGNELFALADDPLTDSILAEAAWRYLQGGDPHLASFAPSDFAKTPICVDHESDPPKQALTSP